MTFPNPLIPGFSPDPSVVPADGAYYLVTSTFEYLPGIPVYRSTDLVTWTHIGNVATRPEQAGVDGVATGGGVWAPTIRYRDGVFYVIVTIAMSPRGCVIFTADRPGRPVERWHHHRRRRRHRPRPGVGRRRHGLRHLLRAAHQRRAGRPAPGHPAGPGQPRRRQGARGAALTVVRHRAEVPGGTASVPARRLLVPGDRRGRHRARAWRQRRPGTLPGGSVRGAPRQPGAQRAQHVPPDPEHRPRGPGRHAGRRHGAGPARGAAARPDSVVLAAGPGNVHHAGLLGRRLAAAGTGAAGAARRRRGRGLRVHRPVRA